MKSILAATLFLSTCIGFAAPAKPDVSGAAREIDALLTKDWTANKLKGNTPADDSVFVRRIYLDVVGRIPTTRETEEFMGSKEKDKRAKLIDKLLASDGYVQHFFNYWADVLRAQSQGQQLGQITGAAYTNFIKDALRTNKPYDQFVKEMIAAQGKAWETGAIGYYMRDRGMPLDNMASTVRVFLGTRIECAQCHNHPFDKWTQMQFYKMAAFTFGVETNDYYGGTTGGMRDLLRNQEVAVRESFKQPQPPKKMKDMTEAERTAFKAEVAKVEAARRAAQEKIRHEQRFYNQATQDIRDTMRYTAVDFKENRKVTLPHDYKYEDAKPKSVVAPGTMMGHSCEPMPGETQLQAYARWMASPDNERFTKVIANRLWKKAFGQALIEPLDELMDNTVAVNPPLEQNLEKLMITLKYDMKAYMRVLFNTSAYQRQVTREEVVPGVAYHFTGPLLRRMSPEQMWDSFVTLINPNPDMPNVISRDTMEQRVLAAKKSADSVDSLTPEEMLKGIKVAAKKYEAQSEAVTAKQKLIAAAREDAKKFEDEAASAEGTQKEALEAKAVEAKTKYKALSKEINEMYSDARRAVVSEVFVPGQKKLFEKVTGKPYVQVALNTNGKAGKEEAESTANPGGSDMMMMAAYGTKKGERIVIPGYDKLKKSKEEEAAAVEAQKKAWAEEADFYGIGDKQRKEYFRSRAQQTRDYLRAAEIESPAPRGHYLREFGQSDREMIENSNSEASVPQALALMNGSLLPQITNRFSQLMLTVNKAPYPDEKVEAAYMTLLSRKPTAREKDLWLQAQDKGLSTMDDLIYALINTQQFIFIQ
ncbi:MAG: hypothetical protein JWO08_3496 [Verrucomicrobiaceae bacterium]|nr:hypothetical protein [Verrucomicrobiaceae bacterium]